MCVCVSGWGVRWVGGMGGPGPQSGRERRAELGHRCTARRPCRAPRLPLVSNGHWLGTAGHGWPALRVAAGPDPRQLPLAYPWKAGAYRRSL